jgi:hypothetical protein
MSLKIKSTKVRGICEKMDDMENKTNDKSTLNYSCIQIHHDNIARKYERETNTKITNQMKKFKTCETLNRITLSPTTTYEFHRQNALSYLKYRNLDDTIYYNAITYWFSAINSLIINGKLFKMSLKIKNL